MLSNSYTVDLLTEPRRQMTVEADDCIVVCQCHLTTPSDETTLRPKVDEQQQVQWLPGIELAFSVSENVHSINFRYLLFHESSGADTSDLLLVNP